MKVKFAPSVNIIRDVDIDLNFIATANTKGIANSIFEDYQSGIHAFNLVGSYGTGKSTFLWALAKEINGNKNYFKSGFFNGFRKVRIENIIGEPQSLKGFFLERYNLKLSTKSSILFDKIYQDFESLGKQGLLVFMVDEFGKFLEHASANNPKEELYFIQQFVEFINKPNRNILFISTLHQGFDRYAYGLNALQRNEWTKVKGRLKEIAFNEPIEQLLYFAADKLDNNNKKKLTNSTAPLILKHHLFNGDKKELLKLEKQVFPLETIAAFVLTTAMQRYGQNERSLFSFLESNDELAIKSWKEKTAYQLPEVYDYLLYHFYSFLSSKNNPDYNKWSKIKMSIERIEVMESLNISLAIRLIKTLGLINIFSKSSYKINDTFFNNYFKNAKTLKETIAHLTKIKILGFLKERDTYVLKEGSDIDIELEIIEAANKIERIENIEVSLKKHFDFLATLARAHALKTGTPRYFEYIISNEAINKKPEGALDGYINLVFGKERIANLKKNTAENDTTIYVVFKSQGQIKNTLFDLEKTQQVIDEHRSDKKALKELEQIKEGQVNLLNHYVFDGLFSKEVIWMYKGEKITIKRQRDLNKLLSEVCDAVYHKAPVYKNEIINKHKISGSGHSARKELFTAIVENEGLENLGFEDHKFPPQKTIYISLLKENGMHSYNKALLQWELNAPSKKSTFKKIWEEGIQFIKSSTKEPINISKLNEIFTSKPYKLKGGLIDLWTPIFLYVNREQFALYSEEGYIPIWNEPILNRLTRNPEDFKIKAFDIKGVRLNLYNKYRKLLELSATENLSNQGFIESIKPFLVFYKNLSAYVQQTKQLSATTIAVRNAIIQAKDPEKLFFEDFPNALGVSLSSVAKSQKSLEHFISNLQAAIDEMKDAYPSLINRVEQFLLEEIILNKTSFKSYKNILKDRWMNLKPYLIPNHLKSFINRINSPLEEREPWLQSIAQAILKKNLDSINDKEEALLYETLKTYSIELDNLLAISNAHQKDELENIVKLDFTDAKGMKSQVIRLDEKANSKTKKLMKQIEELLPENYAIAVDILSKLLRERFL